MQTPPALPSRGSRAIVAGWVCFGVGLLTFWVFGLGLLFLGATLALGIFLLATRRLTPGLMMVISSAASLIVCSLICIVLLPVFMMPIMRHHQRDRIIHFIRGDVAPHKQP
jgi:hypothetical protein